jgi:putative transposase
MISITIDLSEAKQMVEQTRREGLSLLETLQGWVRAKLVQVLEALLQAELEILLERDREERKPGERPNWRNGYRRRSLSLGGLGRVFFQVPRDRQGKYRSEILPFRKRRTQEFEEMAAELFLAGLSTRDVSRVLERHFGERFDSKEVSRMVEATSRELDQWRHRDLAETTYPVLFLDGTHFSVRRGQVVEKIPVLVVVGMRQDTEKLEVLALEVGDREGKALWEEVLREVVRRGLRAERVELGVMDGLPGLEEVFCRLFPNAKTQRCHNHAKRNAVRRVSKKERDEFRKDLNRVFYANSEAAARRAFVELGEKWRNRYPTAVGVIERDLNSLLRFYAWEPRYWPSLRTTNPIERVNKEFKRRTKAMEILGGEKTTYRLLAYVAMTMNLAWKSYVLSAPKHFYTLNAA